MLFYEYVIFGYFGYVGDVMFGLFDYVVVFVSCIEMVWVLLVCGIQMVVDVIFNDCGCNLVFLCEVSEVIGFQILCVIGFYYEGEGVMIYFKFCVFLGDVESEIYEMMWIEVIEGIVGIGICVGVIKLVSSCDVIIFYE